LSVIRLLVCGSRDYRDADRLTRTLDAIHRKHAIEVLIHGACHLGGADSLADAWARERRLPVLDYPVKREDGLWPGAGPARNRRMLVFGRPTHGVAFLAPDARNNGTRNMVLQFNAWSGRLAPMWVVAP
jgi:hypothetical protein